MKRLGLCLILLAVSTVALSGCATPVRTGTILLPAVTSVPVPAQSGYGHNEQFCGTLGKIEYVANKKQVQLRLHVAAVKANRQYLIDWQNNRVRGYTIGVFSTDHSGGIRRGSLKLFRAGEVRGAGLRIYYLHGNTPSGIQHFKPC